MENNKQQRQIPQVQSRPEAPARKPDDVGKIKVDGFVKIFDPNTKEIFVEKRA